MATITEDYVSYEVAKLLKEKGFDGDTSCYYTPDNEKRWVYQHYQDFDKKDRIECPTLYMAMKWLREDHHIHILPQISDPSQVNPKYYIVIWTTGLKRESYILELFNSYEEAVEEGIKYCLEDLI